MKANRDSYLQTRLIQIWTKALVTQITKQYGLLWRSVKTVSCCYFTRILGKTTQQTIFRVVRSVCKVPIEQSRPASRWQATVSHVHLTTWLIIICMQTPGYHYVDQSLNKMKYNDRFLILKSAMETATEDYISSQFNYTLAREPLINWR